MIYKMEYSDTINTDLNISTENMNIKIKMTEFKDNFNNIEKTIDVSIPFESDSKYDKIISIYLTNNKLIVDERFNDQFYYETPVIDLIDKICWFTLPKNYNNTDGLNGIEIYTKGGNNNG
jgi:hypothetical protein